LRPSLLFVLACAGCRPEASPRADGSPGSSRPTIESRPAIVAHAPDSIGGFSGEIGAIRRLSDGSIVVADLGARHLVRFDSIGALLGILGRGGQGPGEFERLELLQVLRADTLLVWDQVARRLTWIDPRTGGTRTAVVSPESDAQRFAVRGQLSGGELLIEESRPPVAGGPRARERVRYLLADVDGRNGRTLVETEGMILGGFYFFAPTAVGVTDGERVYVGESSKWSVQVFDREGDATAEWARPWIPASIAADAKVRMRELYRRRGARPELTADERFLPTVPAFGRLIAANDGSLWVRSYALPYEAPDSVTVFGPSGDFLGSLPLPSGLIPTDVGHNYILGLVRDGDDVAEIHLHRVTWSQ
jgi:hypothetical protein